MAKFWKFSAVYAEQKSTRGSGPDAGQLRVRNSLPRRTSLFEDWLSKQPAGRRLEILTAEREYVERAGLRLAALDEVAYQGLCGLQDTSAGDRPREFFSGTGDWSWQPRRYARDPGYTFIREEVDSLNDGWAHYESDERRAEFEAQMPTYRPPRHPRACPSCHLTACLGPDYHELADIREFQERARSAHRQAGDYNRHTHDYSIP